MANYSCSLLGAQRDDTRSLSSVYYQIEISYAPTNDLQRERILLGRTRKVFLKKVTSEWCLKSGRTFQGVENLSSMHKGMTLGIKTLHTHNGTAKAPLCMISTLLQPPGNLKGLYPQTSPAE